MKSQDLLAQTVLTEWGRLCGIDTTHDLKYIVRRRRKEGDAFYTITLPAYLKAFERALDERKISSNRFQGFHLDSGGLPRFLSGFLRMIFSDTGQLREFSPSVLEAVRAIRQITGLFGKVEDACTPARADAAIRNFVVTDREIPTLSAKALREFTNRSDRYFGLYFREVQGQLRAAEITPMKHGPGAVQNKATYNAKFSSNTWTERLEAVFRAEEHLSSNVHDFLDSPLQWLAEDQEPPVRVVPVPKTMKAPRLIAIEPIWTQFVQQGIFRIMTDALDISYGSWTAKPICGWGDQEPNRKLSRNYGSHATVDLSEASDRVPLQLVEAMLTPYPFLWECVDACRSRVAELPTGEFVTLRKFASMGSALCFPIESLVFSTLAIWACEEAGLDWFDRKCGFETTTTVRVFGDDIIVPKPAIPYLLVLLEAFGFKVNTAKSFWNGEFRESCGYDSFYGFDVSYIKARSSIDRVKRHDVEVLRLVALHNHLYDKGLYESAQVIETKLCKLGLGYYAPLGSDVCAMWTSEWNKIQFRTSPNLQRIEVKCIIPKFSYRDDPLDHYGALRKFFISKVTLKEREKRAFFEILPDADHLEHAGRPLRVNNHVGWGDPTIRVSGR